MKKFRYLLLLLAMSFTFSACELFEAGLTDEEIVDGLKEALKIGTENSVEDARQTDGYNGNSRIRIPFPEDAAIIETTLRNAGFNFIVDELITKLNRAAEDAADKATPIFVDAITNMTITDGLEILQGNDDAATRYLETNTYDQLKTTFKPDIETSLNTVGANNAWTTVTTTYNSIPFVQPANTDLADYTTGKALDGLFVLIADEELKIRQDPAARVTDLLKKVFAEQD